MMVGVPIDRENLAKLNLTRLGVFIHHAVPAWKEGISWLTDNIKLAMAQEEVQTTHDHLLITLKYHTVGVLSLKIAVQEE